LTSIDVNLRQFTSIDVNLPVTLRQLTSIDVNVTTKILLLYKNSRFYKKKISIK
jgi:hypothetical protein